MLDINVQHWPSLLQQSHYLQAVIGLSKSFHSKQEWSEAKLRWLSAANILEDHRMDRSYVLSVIVSSLAVVNRDMAR